MADAGPGAVVRTVTVPVARPLSGHAAPVRRRQAPLRPQWTTVRLQGIDASCGTGQAMDRSGTRSYSQLRELPNDTLAGSLVQAPYGQVPPGAKVHRPRVLYPEAPVMV